jgi:hypothetical protein
MKGSIVKRIGVRGARYSCVWWAAGKQQWKGGFIRRKDAEQYLNAQVRQVHDGTYSPVTPARMKAVFAAWDDDAVEGGIKLGTLKPSTARSYRSCVRTHLLPAFGDVRSDQLSEHVLAKWSRARADNIADGDLSPKTYNNLVNLLSVILAWARQPAHRYLAHDPLANIERLPKVDLERPFLELNQIARLLKAATTQEETILVMLGVYAGLRRGELCAVRWDDFDFREEGVHRALESDVQVGDVALGERDDVHTGEGEALEESRGVFLVAAEAVQRLGEDHIESTAQCIAHQRLETGAKQRGAGYRVVGVFLRDRPVLSLGKSPTDAHLIRNRGVTLVVRRVARVDGDFHAVVPQ